MRSMVEGYATNPRGKSEKEQKALVRAVGLEPTLLAEPDFESGASTNFTTPAQVVAVALAHDPPTGKPVTRAGLAGDSSAPRRHGPAR